MSEEQDRGDALPKVVLIAFGCAVMAGVGAMFVGLTIIIGLTVLGNSLESKFEAVATEVESASDPVPAVPDE